MGGKRPEGFINIAHLTPAPVDPKMLCDGALYWTEVVSLLDCCLGKEVSVVFIHIHTKTRAYYVLGSL